MIGKRDVSSRHRSLRDWEEICDGEYFFLFSHKREREYMTWLGWIAQIRTNTTRNPNPKSCRKKKGNKINKSRNGRKRKPKTPSCICMSVSGNLSLVSRGVRGFLLFWLFIVFYLISSPCVLLLLFPLLYIFVVWIGAQQTRLKCFSLFGMISSFLFPFGILHFSHLSFHVPSPHKSLWLTEIGRGLSFSYWHSFFSSSSPSLSLSLSLSLKWGVVTV